MVETAAHRIDHVLPPVPDLTRNGGARGGVVTLIQRFGGAVNLNLHLRMVALDGLYTKDGNTLRFREVAAPASN